MNKDVVADAASAISIGGCSAPRRDVLRLGRQAELRSPREDKKK